jgi:multidrug efflux pump subunit AcrB
VCVFFLFLNDFPLMIFKNMNIFFFLMIMKRKQRIIYHLVLSHWCLFILYMWLMFISLFLFFFSKKEFLTKENYREG